MNKKSKRFVFVTDNTRRVFSFVLLCAALFVCIGTDKLQASLSDALVGYYTFDGNYNDSSGSSNVNNAFAVGSPNVNVEGLFGKSVYVSGGVNYVSLGKPNDYQFGDSTSFTITYWVRLTANVSSDPGIIGNKDWSVSGIRKGFTQAMGNGDDIKANIADGSHRADCDYIDMDPDSYFNDGKAHWTFCAMTVDRTGKVLTNYVADEHVVTFGDDASNPTTADISAVGSVDSGYNINIGQDGDGSGYTQLNASIDDLAIWRRALSQQELQTIYTEGRAGHSLGYLLANPPAEPVNIKVGPYVQFVGPYTAKVYWDTSSNSNSVVEYGTTSGMGLRVEDNTQTTAHVVTLSDLDYRTKYYYKVGYSDSDGNHFGQTESFDNAINYTRMDCSGIDSPWPTDALTPVYEAAAEYIINQSGITTGYCLVYGCGQGRLAFELAKRSKMMIVGVDDNAGEINAGADKLMQAGVYGARVTLRQVSDMSNLPFTKCFFNLIVSDDMIAQATCPGTAQEMFRVLRPDGGTACLGQPSGCANVLTQQVLTNWLNTYFNTSDYVVSNDSNGLWAKVVRAPLAGSEYGAWPRQYGYPNNTAESYDNLLGATRTDQMQVQWIGSPGADFGADRNPRMPTPVMMHGRLYHEGLNRLLAMDSYNGSIYWSLEIPNLMRVNTPRDIGYKCADTDGLYIAVKDTCWKLDGDTGKRVLTCSLNDPGKEWGYVAVMGDKLYGSAQYAGAHYTDFWGHACWYDATSGSQTYKVCSRYIFADDKNTGARIWTDNRPERGVIINSTITIGPKRVYFVESRDPTAKSNTTGRMGGTASGLWNNQYIVALDANTGAKLWDKAIDTADGIVVFYMQYSGNILFITSSFNGDSKYHVYAYDVTDTSCTPKWSLSQAWVNNNHGGHMQHPVIFGKYFYLDRNAYSIYTGSALSPGPAARSGCPTRAGSKNALIYRGSGGRISMWDMSTGSVTSWTDLRPSCWLSTIAGGGMVLSPEGAGGCSCNGWINTSVGFMKKD